MEQVLWKATLTLLLVISGRYDLDLTAVRPSIDQAFAESQAQGREVAFCVFMTKHPTENVLIADSVMRPKVIESNMVGITIEDCPLGTLLGHTHIVGPVYPANIINSVPDTSFSCGLSEQDLWTARQKLHTHMIVTSGPGQVCWWNANQMAWGRHLRLRYLPAIYGQTTFRMR